MDKNTENLYRAFLSLCSVGECEAFLNDILTPKEISDLSDRLRVAMLLNQGYNYNDIASMTGASTATISRVSKCLSGENGGYRRVISKISAQSGTGNYPPFTIAIPNSDEGISLYRNIFGKLPFMPVVKSKKESVGYGEGGIRLLLATPQDLPVLLSGNACDMIICPEWELIEAELEVDEGEIVPLGKSASLRLFKRYGADTLSRIATPYPRLTSKLLSDRGVSAVKLNAPSSAVQYPGFDGYCDIGDTGGELLAELRYLLVFGENATAEVKELLRASLAQIG